MCSAKLPNLFTSDAAMAVAAAIATVAERSFFAEAQACDDERLAEAAAAADRWLVATIQFREGDAAGTLACSLPEDLARQLLDAFTGRDPVEPPPDAESLFDLVGELSNMICGTWLTRMATRDQSFTLSRPKIHVSSALPDHGAVAAVMSINDLPLLVAITAEHGAAASAAL